MNGQDQSSQQLQKADNYARPGFIASPRRTLGPSTREVLELLSSLERRLPATASV